MATDYDTPRKTDDDVNEDSIEELKARRNDKSASTVDVDEFEQAEGLELPVRTSPMRSCPSGCCLARRTSSPA
ncbi:hypothetical protein SANTM175S_06728 [Streptomyces antimycoticus]